VLLRQPVVTSAGTFRRRGYLRHTLRIIEIRLRFALGGNPDALYRRYYRP
jgi:hypothetical protein